MKGDSGGKKKKKLQTTELCLQPEKRVDKEKKNPSHTQQSTTHYKVHMMWDGTQSLGTRDA